MSLLGAIHGDAFLKDCYNPLGDVMDAMALINSAINFILYCLMSKQFRKTFKQTFPAPRWCAKAASDAQYALCCCRRWRAKDSSSPPQPSTPHHGASKADRQPAEEEILVPRTVEGIANQAISCTPCHERKQAQAQPAAKLVPRSAEVGEPRKNLLYQNVKDTIV